MKQWTGLFFILLALGVFSARAQDVPFVIEGEVEQADHAAWVYLNWRPDQKWRTDSVQMKDGKFRFSGVAQHGSSATLSLGQNIGGWGGADKLRVLLSEEPMRVRTRKVLAHAEIKDRNFTAGRELHWAKVDSLRQVRSRRLQALDSITPEALREGEAYSEKIEEIRGQMSEAVADMYRQFVRNNPDNIASVDALNFITSNPDPKAMRPLFKSLSPRVRNSARGKLYAKLLDNIDQRKIGEMAPAFTQNDPNGNPVSLSDFRGKWVLIDFWASWCAPCRKENPNIVKAYQRYHDQGFEVLGVSLDSKRDDWLKAIEADGLSWTHVSDLKSWQNEVAGLYGIKSIPQNFLVDPKGRIVAADMHGDELADTLAKLLSDRR